MAGDYNDAWQYGMTALLQHGTGSFPNYGQRQGITFYQPATIQVAPQRSGQFLGEFMANNNVDTAKKHWRINDVGLFDTKEKALNEARRLLKSDESAVYTIYEAVASVETEPAPAVVKELV